MTAEKNNIEESKTEWLDGNKLKELFKYLPAGYYNEVAKKFNKGTQSVINIVGKVGNKDWKPRHATLKIIQELKAVATKNKNLIDDINGK